MASIWDILGAAFGAQPSGPGPAIGAAIKNRGAIGTGALAGLRAGTNKPPQLRKGTAGSVRRSTGAVNRDEYLGRNQMQPQIAPRNPLDDLLAMMQGMIGQQGMGSTYDPNYEDLMAQIQGQVDPVYDARRAAVEQLMGQAEQRTATGRQDVEGAYNALAQDYGTMGDEAQANRQQASEEAAALQGQLKKNIQGNYSRIQEEQGDLFSKLGIEAAAPEVLGEQATEQAWLEGQADVRGAASEEYFDQMANTDKAYYEQGAPLAKLAGANASTDMLAQLQDYLAQSEAGITELEGQRTSDTMSAFNQLANQAQQFAQQQTAQSGQQQWGQLMDLFGVMQSMQPEQQPQAMGQANQIAQSFGLDQRQNQEFNQAISDIAASPSFMSGKIEDSRTGESVNMTPNAAQTYIRQWAKENRVSETVAQALLFWAESVYGG